MEVLQTSPLGLLGTAPDARSISKLRSNCQLSRRKENLHAPLKQIYLFSDEKYSEVPDKSGRSYRDDAGTTWASRMKRADSSGGVGQI